MDTVKMVSGGNINLNTNFLEDFSGSLYCLGIEVSRLRFAWDGVNDVALEKSIAFATQKYAALVGHDGFPFIAQALRVMDTVKHPAAKIVVVLSGVLSRTNTSIEELQSAIGTTNSLLIEALHSVTPNKNESETDAVLRARSNQIGRLVLVALARDNINLMRLKKLREFDNGNLTDDDVQLVKRYQNQLVLLGDI